MKKLLTIAICLLFFASCTTTVIESPAPPYEPEDAEGVGVSAEISTENGFDPDMLNQIPAYIEDGYDHLYSVVVLRNGDLIYEWYTDGVTPDTPAVVWSVTKSVTSALIGIALEEGHIESVDQSLAELIPLRIPVDSDPLIEEITLEQLLTMSSGIFCNRDGCHNNSIPQATDQEVKAEPGTTFKYDTGASHLLAAVLEDATGMSPFEYASEKIFTPLGFENIDWEVDSDGLNFGGKGLLVRPRDMAKFGQLYLDEGAWNGEQLVPAAYVRESTVDQLAGVIADDEYGYLWWPSDVNGRDAYAAVGFGGQYITVVPDYELVVVITSNFSRPRSGNDAIIHELIVPAIVD